MQVTDEQRRFFDTFGFCRFRELFKPDEAAAFATALEGALARARDGAAFAGEERQAVVPFIECDPIFYDLLDDARLMDVVEGLLGEDCLYTGGSDGNYYVGDTRWHADGGVHADNGVMGAVPARQGRLLSRPGERGERLPQRPTRQPRPELRRLHLARPTGRSFRSRFPRRPRALPSGVNARRHDRLRFAALAFLLRRSHRAAHVQHDLRGKSRGWLAGDLLVRLGGGAMPPARGGRLSL